MSIKGSRTSRRAMCMYPGGHRFHHISRRSPCFMHIRSLHIHAYYTLLYFLREEEEVDAKNRNEILRIYGRSPFSKRILLRYQQRFNRSRENMQTTNFQFPLFFRFLSLVFLAFSVSVFISASDGILFILMLHFCSSDTRR